MFQRVADTPVKDDKTFQIVLKEPYGLVLEALGKIETNLPVIMRKKEAETDPNAAGDDQDRLRALHVQRGRDRAGAALRLRHAIRTTCRARSRIGHGRRQGRQGRPRHLSRTCADEQTAVAALQAGEIDFYEMPPIDLLDQLESDKNIKLDVLNKGGNVGMCRLNCLHPPFDKVEGAPGDAAPHQAGGHPQGGVRDNPKYYRSCASLFACGSRCRTTPIPTGSRAARTSPRPRSCSRRPATTAARWCMLQATNIAFMNNRLAARRPVAAGGRRQRASSLPPTGARSSPAAPSRSRRDEGGWNIFITWGSGEGFDNPIAFVAHTANGRQGWFGWPKDDLHEKLRDDWALPARSRSARRSRASCRRTPGTTCRWRSSASGLPPVACRANIKGFMPVAEPTCRSGTSRRRDDRALACRSSADLPQRGAVPDRLRSTG